MDCARCTPLAAVSFPSENPEASHSFSPEWAIGEVAVPCAREAVGTFSLLGREVPTAFNILQGSLY